MAYAYDDVIQDSIVTPNGALDDKSIVKQESVSTVTSDDSTDGEDNSEEQFKPLIEQAGRLPIFLTVSQMEKSKEDEEESGYFTNLKTDSSSILLKMMSLEEEEIRKQAK